MCWRSNFDFRPHGPAILHLIGAVKIILEFSKYLMENYINQTVRYVCL